eukprot:15352643-Ditylum_brightwellii.AAC.1
MPKENSLSPKSLQQLLVIVYWMDVLTSFSVLGRSPAVYLPRADQQGVDMSISALNNTIT